MGFEREKSYNEVDYARKGLEMKAIRDAERVELNHLLSACPLPGKRVLEIGCGNGVLTWQYAGLCWQVTGIDPKMDDLLKAKTDQPISLTNASFTRTKGETLPFAAGTFDVAMFASSL
jgi:ubiquinone/menaquinone biosynthesis C-methylase UbiE